MEDRAVKEYFDDKNNSKHTTSITFANIIQKLILFKQTIQNYYNFLKYYYSEKTGLLFRYDFIINTLDQKLHEGKVDIPTVAGFKKIRESFIKLKSEFESQGLFNFGPDGYWYIDIIQFIYKCCKILEFIYLRSSNYDRLKELRNDILFKIEKEIVAYNKNK